MKKRFILLLTMVGLLAACSGNAEPTPTITPAPTTIPATDTPSLSTPTGETVRGQARVDSIQILTGESFPVQISVRVRGELPDGCTMVDDVITQQIGTTFQSVVGTIRPGDAVCTAEVVPFEEVVPLEVEGLDAGTYTVTVNGISGSFTLDVDNRIEAEATPTAEPTETAPPPPDTAVITGRIWHDLCAVVGDESAEAEPAEGCIALTGGGFQANGILDDEEPGIKGVTVSLGEGECPADDLAATTTDSDGSYTFGDLAAGTYCVSVDALAEANSEILLPGSFTFPDTDVNSETVTIVGGEATTAVNFGWDYQFLPLPEVDPATCTNSVQFVDDITVPDDTVIPPGGDFVKTWRLRNNGTCPWIEGYKIVAIDDEPLGGDTEALIDAPVAPGQTTEVSVSLIAPEAIGTYRSNWQMNTADGTLFGVDGFLDDAFWLQIVVSEVEATAVPNSASISGVIWSDFCSIQTNGNPTANCVATAEGSNVFTGNGTQSGNESGLAGIKIELGDGACPEDGVITAANLVATTTTDDNGLYTFTGLEGGTYCVSIDAFSADNLDLLIPGDWTYPARGTGRLGIILGAGEERTEVDFGWDHADD